MIFEKKPYELEHIANDVYFSKSTGTVVELGHYDRDMKSTTFADIGDVSTHYAVKDNTVPEHRIKNWGGDNRLPLRRELMLMDSNIVGALISKKCDILAGQSMEAETYEYTDDGKKIPKLIPIPDPVNTWIRKSRFRKRYLNNAIINYYKHANVFVEFMMAKDGKVLYMKVHDCKYVRAAEKVNGYIPGFYIMADWERAETEKSVGVEENKIYYIPNIPEDWTPDSNVKLPDQFMVHFGDSFFHDGYYYHPTYWGGKEWIETANFIPRWHKANVDNGYTPRFHIKVPKDYFLDKNKLSMAKTADEIAACVSSAQIAQQKFIDNFNKFLAGIQNAGRALVTTEDFDPLMKQFKGISIEPINYEMKDEALLKLFDSSNDANITAQGFPRALAGIDTQGKLSAGAEIRNILAYYIISELPRRREDILDPFDIMLMINGWYDPKIKYTFEDILITKLDENKSGTDAPAPDNQNTAKDDVQ